MNNTKEQDTANDEQTLHDRLEELINDIRRNPSTDSVHIHSLFNDVYEGVKEELREKIGDYCHEQYLGCTLENGIWNYGYKGEVINMVRDFFESQNNR